MNYPRAFIVLAWAYLFMLAWIWIPDVRLTYYTVRSFVKDVICGPDYKWEAPSDRPEAPTNFRLEIEPDPKPFYDKDYRSL